MTRALITTVPFGEADPASLELLDEATCVCKGTVEAILSLIAGQTGDTFEDVLLGLLTETGQPVEAPLTARRLQLLHHSSHTLINLGALCRFYFCGSNWAPPHS